MQTHNNIGVYVALAVVAIVAIGGYFFPQLPNAVAHYGAIVDTEFYDYFSASTGYWLGTPLNKTPSDTNAILQRVTVGSCNTATSTLFAVQPPTQQGTSTVIFFEIYGTQGATTTDIQVGTSTTPALAANFGTTTLNENVMGLASVATSSQFYSVAGATLGSASGYNSPAGTPVAGVSYKTTLPFQVGPNDYLIGVSTSSYASYPTNGGLNAFAAIPASCTYKIVWER